MTNEELLNELLTMERRGWDSLCGSTGADFYGSVMVDDAVMILAHGLVMDREAVIASLNDAPPWHGYEISDARAISAGTDSTILVYTGVAFREGNSPAFRGIMSSSYVRVDGDWKLVLYQQTPIPSRAEEERCG